MSCHTITLLSLATGCRFLCGTDPPPSRSPNLLTQGGYSQKNWIGMCSVCPKTFILFLTKICICFLLGIYDLTLNILVSDLPDNQVPISDLCLL